MDLYIATDTKTEIILVLYHKLKWTIDAARDLLFKPKYVPKEFWRKKHENEGFAAVGIRRLTEEQNAFWYDRMKIDLLSYLKRINLDISDKSVLEIGPGTGYWTELIQELGCSNYLGIDISESAVDKLSEKFSSYNFLSGDFSEMDINGKWDIVVMIHVDEHIHGENFVKSMNSIKNIIQGGGIFIVSAYHPEKKSWVPHVEYHGISDFTSVFPKEWVVDPVMPFADDLIVGITPPFNSKI
tara:strand:+ start:367 stop:1089 length:723 start_codon:yes stop_codon:yes gene_type:complete